MKRIQVAGLLLALCHDGFAVLPRSVAECKASRKEWSSHSHETKEGRMTSPAKYDYSDALGDYKDNASYDSMQTSVQDKDSYSDLDVKQQVSALSIACVGYSENHENYIKYILE